MSDEILIAIHQRVEKMSEDLTDIKVTQAQQHVSLQEHMKRSDAAERGIEILHEEIKPLKIHVSQIEAISKFIAVLGTIASVIIGLFKLFGKI